jgi:hypothetical protein
MSEESEEEAKMWPTAYCRECNRAFPQKESWAKKCVLCFKEDRGYALLSGDMSFLWAQMEIERLREENARLAHRRVKPPADPTSVLTPEFIRELLSLTHPDRHKNSERATRVTQQLLDLRKTLKER